MPPSMVKMLTAKYNSSTTKRVTWRLSIKAGST